MNRTLILLLIFISNLSFSQSLLDMTEEEIKKGDLERAKRQINILKNSESGFCGNSVAKIKGEISFLESKIAIKEKDYDKSLEILNSIKEECVFGNNCEKRDSLKIETLFMKYGKRTILSSFKNKEKLKIISLNHFHYQVYLENIDYKFIFFSNGYEKNYEHPKYGTISKRESNNSFIDMCKELKFYKLIIE
ncbi:hypothetical protein BTO06_11920 [Tenacibaculum sp. SZ-18]|uniref:hypothetical protein n=1 Tax=Tenacibaculum sp. SZ-18 TaxID=754423 RepID=UPI000C2CF432|nr:hypothetical protein [Tenacibaculum sp. SZ-18]AUC15812.1 hypothetical protein BTO06_11920 [Tenacibaculum sp. SZ-18]